MPQEILKSLQTHGEALDVLMEKVSSTPLGNVHAEGAQETGLADVKSLIHRPPLFYGEKPETENVRAWLRSRERIVGPLVTTNWGKTEFVAGLLRGNAQSMYETGIEQQKPSFEELSAFLITEFGEKNPEHHARLTLIDMHMKEGDLTRFKTDFMRNLSLCVKNPVNRADAIEFFYRELTAELQTSLCMDPVIKLWWTDLKTLVMQRLCSMARGRVRASLQSQQRRLCQAWQSKLPSINYTVRRGVILQFTVIRRLRLYLQGKNPFHVICSTLIKR